MPLEVTIDLLSKCLLKCGAGELAELRRMKVGGTGPLPYWRLAAGCDFLNSDPAIWMQIVHILAILTPKGDKLATDCLHDSKRRLGGVLCDGGDGDWPSGREPRPFISETRFARLLATPADQRGDSLTRFARMLAAKRDRAIGVNCTEIADLLLSPDAKHNLQNIARDYYRRLDSATRKTEKEEAQK